MGLEAIVTSDPSNHAVNRSGEQPEFQMDNQSSPPGYGIRSAINFQDLIGPSEYQSKGILKSINLEAQDVNNNDRPIQAFSNYDASKRTSLLILVASTALLGCTPKPKSVPMPITPSAKFEIHTTTTANDPTAIEATDPTSGGPLFLKTPPIVTTSDIATVTQTETEGQTIEGKPSGYQRLGIFVKLTQSGSAKMVSATSNANGNQVAVVVNGKVIFTPKMFSQIKDSFEISGDNALITSAFEALTKR